MVAAQRRGRHAEARRLAEKLVLGCVGSGYAERWNPDTGGRSWRDSAGLGGAGGRGYPRLEGAWAHVA